MINFLKKMFTGRMNRKQFLLPMLSFIFLPYTYIYLILGDFLNSYIFPFLEMIFYCILIIIFAPFFLFLKVVKRLHDIGWSGWWTVLFFIPIVNIPFILLLIFKAGYKEANHYGLVSKPTRWGNIISFIILMLCLIPMLNFINPFHLPAGLYILYPGIIIPKTITGIWRPVYVRDNQESNIHHIHFPHAASTKPCAKTTGMQTNVEQKDHVLNVVLLGSKQYENSSDDFFCKFGVGGQVSKNIAVDLNTTREIRISLKGEKNIYRVIQTNGMYELEPITVSNVSILSGITVPDVLGAEMKESKTGRYFTLKLETGRNCDGFSELVTETKQIDRVFHIKIDGYKYKPIEPNVPAKDYCRGVTWQGWVMKDVPIPNDLNTIDSVVFQLDGKETQYDVYKYNGDHKLYIGRYFFTPDFDYYEDQPNVLITIWYGAGSYDYRNYLRDADEDYNEDYVRLTPRNIVPTSR